jgi:hypothetical protein
MKRVASAVCIVIAATVLSACAGSASQPASTPDSSPATGLPAAGRTQDVVDQANQRTSQLEQQSGSGQP